MAGENWGRRIVEQELNKTVVINDDGSAPRMYDLRIGPAHAPQLAIECFQAVDSEFTETWSVGPAKGPLKLSLKGNWIVEVSPRTRIKTFAQRVEPLLQDLENRGLREVIVDFRLKWQDSELFSKLSTLNVNHAICYEMPGAGNVQLGLPGVGGAVDERGAAIPGWINELLRNPKYDDVLRKLEHSGATAKHAFVLVGFAGAPWEVEGYLTGDMNQIPTQPPDLPFPLTGVWMISQTNRKGLRWDGRAWHLFEAP